MDKENTRYKETILLKAKEIAVEEGITKINIRSVARKSGIAIGTVYNYYPSKADLLVAVIEDFWESAFANVDWKSFKDDNFYNNIEKVYNLLYHYLHKFKESWLEQLALLNNQEKVMGIKKQNEYFDKIAAKIKMLMDMDKVISKYPWSEVITQDATAEFIFNNMLLMLRNEEENIQFFTVVLKKILSY